MGWDQEVSDSETEGEGVEEKVSGEAQRSLSWVFSQVSGYFF